MDKLLLATKELVLESKYVTKTKIEWRATQFVSGIGYESVAFDPAVYVSGKVESYLNSLLNGQKTTLSNSLKNCIERYPKMTRTDWVNFNDGEIEPSDPAQIMLLVGNINFVKQVEKGFKMTEAGNVHAMLVVLEDIQVQLNDLMALTMKQLSKGERQRVMCLIIADAHCRDIVESIVKQNIKSSQDFLWLSKARPQIEDLPPATAVVVNSSDATIMTSASITILDSKFTYGFEYLGTNYT